jgi:hypothetical protein
MPHRLRLAPRSPRVVASGLRRLRFRAWIGRPGRAAWRSAPGLAAAPALLLGRPSCAAAPAPCGGRPLWPRDRDRQVHSIARQGRRLPAELALGRPPARAFTACAGAAARSNSRR